jgi:hypothetical protein
LDKAQNRTEKALTINGFSTKIEKGQQTSEQEADQQERVERASFASQNAR